MRLFAAVAILAVVSTGCKNKSGLGEIGDPPRVDVTSPADREDSVAVNTAISATFNRQMNPSSINDTTFTVFHDTTTIPGTMSYQDSTATFAPSANLPFNSIIHARINNGVADMDGNTMDTNFEWSFTTSENSDREPPEVIETNPANNTQNVPLSSAVTATFSEEMNPSTLTTATFLLEKGTSLISGSVSYSANTAVFSPSENLEAGSEYSATITDGVQDTAGNALPENYEWSFKTAEDTDDVAPQVSSTDPDNNEENVAVGASVQATFSEPMDASTISASTFTLSEGGTSVNGSVSYSDNTATFNPNDDLEHGTQYTATITTGAEDEAGNALTEDYEWNFTTEDENATGNEAPSVTSTDPDNNEENVAVGASLHATFSEPMDASTISTSTFILSAGGSSINGSVSYSDNTATFNPSDDLEHDTQYTATITTGAKDQAGNSLTEDYEWNFTTEDEDATDNEAPSISSTDPDDNEENVAVGTSLQATFSEPMDASTISTSTFTLSGGGSSVNGSVSYSDNTATFNPNDDLVYDTKYTATITTGAKDQAGNSISKNYKWDFRTEEEPDNEPPSVSSTDPDDGENNVAVGASVRATFSEPMDASTISTSTFTLSGGGSSVNGSVSYSGNTATFNPNGNLDYNTRYTATITTGAEDEAGNALSEDYEWDFRTEEEPDNEPPSVSSTDPDDNEENVAVGTSVQATFSEPMDASTISTSTFTLSGGGSSVNGSVNYSGNTATFNPNDDLEHDTQYTATITTGAKDQAGNSISENYEWSFTTEQAEDNDPPQVTETFPEDGDKKVETDITITASFNEPLDPGTVDEDTFVVRRRFLGLFVRVAGSVSYSGTTASFEPDNNLLNDIKYYITITTGVTDLAGNNLNDDYEWEFETKKQDDDDDDDDD